MDRMSSRSRGDHRPTSLPWFRGPRCRRPVAEVSMIRLLSGCRDPSTAHRRHRALAHPQRPLAKTTSWRVSDGTTLMHDRDHRSCRTKECAPTDPRLRERPFEATPGRGFRLTVILVQAPEQRDQGLALAVCHHRQAASRPDPPVGELMYGLARFEAKGAPMRPPGTGSQAPSRRRPRPTSGN